MLILYLSILIPALYWVSKILLPEMSKPSIPEISSEPISQSNEDENRIEKLEIFLAEKNKRIVHLETELRMLYAQVNSFDKVKALLEEEIHRLRDQNRIFRSELGLPAAQPKEKSII